MKTLATIFNWVLGGFVMVGALLASVRFQDTYGFLNYLFVFPFASALAVRYLKPNFWLALFSKLQTVSRSSLLYFLRMKSFQLLLSMISRCCRLECWSSHCLLY